MSDALYKDRKLRRIKKECVKAQKLLKNRDRPEKKRSIQEKKYRSKKTEDRR